MDKAWRQAICNAFAADPRAPIAVYVFGSVARGTEHAKSDIDIAVLYPDGGQSRLEDLPLDIEDDLQKELGRALQIVVLNQASADLVHKVLRDGILVLETDRSLRIRFEVRLRNQYFDIKPYLDRYRRVV